MKKTVTLLSVITTSILFGQASSKLNNAQNITVSVATPMNLIGAEPLPSGTWIKYDFASIRFGTGQVTGLDTYIQGLAYPLTGNPSGFLTSVPAQSWSSITGKPIFNSVATSGDYNDLINKPTIPSGQVNSDWNATSGLSQILNKPSLFSGSYIDLTNKPTIYNFTGTSLQYTKGDGSYATFPTSLSSFTNDAGYLTGINSSQVVSALGYTPTPSARTLTINGVSQDLSTNRTWTVGDVTSSSLSTTLSGYVTTSSLNTALSNYTTSVNLSTALAGKENTITAGTTSQYWRGDKTWATLNTTNVPEGTNLYYTDARARASNSAGTGISYNTTTGVITNSAPDQTVSITGSGGTTVTGTYPNFTVSTTSGKRQLTYTGTTDATGNYTVTFATPFSATPNIQQNLIGGNALQGTLITNISTTGFTIQAFTRSTVSTLPVLGVLTAALVGTATNPLVGGTVHVLITEN